MANEPWLVTGGSGFIGSHLIRRLRADGIRVVALVRSERAERRVRALGAEALRGELRSVNDWASAIDSAALVVNAAGVHPPEWRPSRYFEVNVEALLGLARACQVRSKRLVHISSEAAVAMGRPLVRVDENEPLAVKSRSPYARSKAMGEVGIVNLCTRGLDAVILRPRFVWGPDDPILNGVLDAIDAGKFKFVGDGTHLTSTTHVDNLSEAVILASRRGSSGEAYFIADRGDVPFADQVGSMARAMGREVSGASIGFARAQRTARLLELVWRLPIFSSPPPLTSTMVWLLGLPTTLDCSKAHQELGYEPIISRDKGLARLNETSGGEETEA